MAIIKPFRGIRPPQSLVEEVESRPYDVLNSEEARKEAEGNEKSLYHIRLEQMNTTPVCMRKRQKIFKSFRIKAGYFRIKRNSIISMRRP